ncbi:MAG: sodium:calcium antiporter [Woeseiaceae bacterium]|nr:sodium:calcium antiporter [Woeseiaceae bacterium]MDX2608112.1 sodium:calcium antiporter [Woeseiaceae bacterium]
MEFLALLAGLVGLWLGTEATIRGAVAIAARLRISEFIIGAVVLSIGSDLPELTIAVDAALETLQSGQASDIVVGSALGSALGQIGFVLGVTGLTASLALPRKIVYQHGGMLLGSLVLLGLFGLDGHVSRTEGISLITVYAIYLAFLLADATAVARRSQHSERINLVASLVYLVIGLVIVIGSAELTVSSATRLAAVLNLEQSFIAVIIIGLGSSLPELSISVAAAFKRRARLSVGNLIGSNIFDTLIPVGVAAAIVDLKFDYTMLRFELPFLFLLSVLVLVLFRQSRGIQKREAAIILGVYLGYVTIKIAST